MRKSIIIAVVLVIVLSAGGYIYYKYYSPHFGNVEEISEEELKQGRYYGDYNQKKIGTPDDWLWSEAGKSSAWYDPDYEDGQVVGGCAGVQNIYWHECCENWARENGISHIMCAGNWTVENNQCTWRCVSEDEFCGVSLNSCNNDEDCIINGHICQNKNQVTEVPSEIWRDCYNYTKYSLYCMCAGGQCKWVGGIV